LKRLRRESKEKGELSRKWTMGGEKRVKVVMGESGLNVVWGKHPKWDREESRTRATK